MSWRRNQTIFALLAVLPIFAACNRDKDVIDSGPSIGTGWFVDTADPENCTHTVVRTSPEEDDAGWYWRTPLRVWTATDNASAS